MQIDRYNITDEFVMLYSCVQHECSVLPPHFLFGNCVVHLRRNFESQVDVIKDQPSQYMVLALHPRPQTIH